MRDIGSIKTDEPSGTIGFLDAGSAPQIGRAVTITVTLEKSPLQQVSGELCATTHQGELRW